MRFDSTFLHSKLARRIIRLFVFGALLPASVKLFAKYESAAEQLVGVN